MVDPPATPAVMWNVMAALSATGCNASTSNFIDSVASKERCMKARMASRPSLAGVGYGSTWTASGVNKAA